MKKSMAQEAALTATRVGGPIIKVLHTIGIPVYEILVGISEEIKAGLRYRTENEIHLDAGRGGVQQES